MEGITAEGIFTFLIFLLIYFIPTIIAYNRKHNNKNAIFTLNIFAFTGICWLISLVWALTDNIKK